MASILTNTSAMVALQNLRTINNNLVDTQNQIATGKKIATATDNSAIWAVSKVIESDVNAFKAISDSLNLGDSTIGVAREAAETVTDILTQLKGNIVAAQEENVDRSKIQADIDTQVAQIESIISAASFNGLSLVEGTEDVTILGSLQRDSLGVVSSSEIAINRNDLTTNAGTYNSSGTQIGDSSVGTATFNTALSGTNIANTGNTAVVTFEAGTGTGGVYTGGDTLSVSVGGVQIDFTSTATDTIADVAAFFEGQINALGIQDVTASVSSNTLVVTSTNAFSTVDVAISGASAELDATAITSVNGGAPSAPNTGTASTIAQRAESITFSATAAVVDGDGYQASFGGNVFRYIAGPNEDFGDVARGLKAAIDAGNVTGVTTQVTQDATTGAFTLSIDNSDAAALTLAVDGRSGGQASGGLFGLNGLDVTSNDSAASALANIDTFINTAIDAAASFGSDQSRIDLQSSFISKLTDSLKVGIGSLVDADLEAASARLQALQVQQQLGVQSLSIANQAPQSILSLFR
ncbi:MAG: flagellin [Pseudomonadota bacterium]